jgi:hypothetical protein
MRDKVLALPDAAETCLYTILRQTVLGLVLRISPERIEPNTPLGSLEWIADGSRIP